MLLLSVVWACLAGGTLAAEAPSERYNLQAAGEPSRAAGPRQFFYVQQPQFNQVSQQLERLEFAAENPDAQYYHPSQQRQDGQSLGDSASGKGVKEAPAKLESLEPDAELLPGAQQGQPQGPPAQAPVAPSIPGLLPGQRFYIVHPQHQIYNQNPLYPGLPNGFRPNVQVPGYQRFYIVQAQPGVGDGSFAPQAGYQNAILIDPSSGQAFGAPQLIQPNFQRLIAPEAPQPPTSNYPAQNANYPAPNSNYAAQNSNYRAPNTKYPIQNSNYPAPNSNYPAQNSNYAPPSSNYAAPNEDYAEPMRNSVEPGRNYAGPPRGYQELQQAEFIGAQPQFAPAFAGLPTAALPFFGFGRQENPYQQQGLAPNRNAIQFSQLLSLQPGPAPAGAVAARGQGGAVGQAAHAQGREDADAATADYGDEEKKDDISTEANTFQESVKKSDEKSVEPALEETKSTEDTKEEMETAPSKQTRGEKAAAIQNDPKRS